jgi:maleylpyruvate isomerase
MVVRRDLATDQDLLDQLLVVRHGTAWFRRQVGLLADGELDEPSLLPGWSRRHVLAHVGYNARALTRLVDWANTGVENPMYRSPEDRADEIGRGATQPPRALRHLTEHAAITLDVAWRDTPDAAWSAVVRTAQGRTVPLTETVWMRNREVWLHAIDLNNGAGLRDVPRHVLGRLLTDITSFWARSAVGNGLRVIVADAPTLNWGSGEVVVAGDLPAVVGWASGRTSALLDEGRAVAPPRWI